MYAYTVSRVVVVVVVVVVGAVVYGVADDFNQRDNYN